MIPPPHQRPGVAPLGVAARSRPIFSPAQYIFSLGLLLSGTPVCWLMERDSDGRLVGILGVCVNRTEYLKVLGSASPGELVRDALLVSDAECAMGYADLEGGQLTGAQWVPNTELPSRWIFGAVEPGSYYTLEDLAEGRVTVERLMGHRSAALCGFMQEVGLEFVARPFGDDTPSPGTIGRLRSRYHDPDPPTFRELLAAQAAHDEGLTGPAPRRMAQQIDDLRSGPTS